MTPQKFQEARAKLFATSDYELTKKTVTRFFNGQQAFLSGKIKRTNFDFRALDPETKETAVKFLISIAKAYNVNIDFLMGRKSERLNPANLPEVYVVWRKEGNWNDANLPPWIREIKPYAPEQPKQRTVSKPKEVQKSRLTKILNFLFT